jgi:hypothetical protein
MWFFFSFDKFTGVFLYIFLSYYRIILIVTAERVDSVGEEDCIKIKTEQHYIQLVHTVNTEDEMSVVCWCILW